MAECVVCKRISPKIVFEYAHKIFDGNKKEEIHTIAKEACEIINRLDSQKRMFFCGKKHASVLSGLFYSLAFKHEIRRTQEDIASVFPITVVTVRLSFKRWRKTLPEISDWVYNTGCMSTKEKEEYLRNKNYDYRIRGNR